MPGKSKIKTFYTLMSKGGYINDNADGMKEKVKRDWHV